MLNPCNSCFEFLSGNDFLCNLLMIYHCIGFSMKEELQTNDEVKTIWFGNGFYTLSKESFTFTYAH